MFDSWQAILGLVAGVLIFYAIVLWLGIVYWTYHDISDRSRDAGTRWLAVLLVLRTRRPFWRSRPGRALVTTCILIAAVTVALPYSALAEPLGFVGLPARVVGALAGLTALYVGANEAIKRRVMVAD